MQDLKKQDILTSIFFFFLDCDLDLTEDLDLCTEEKLFSLTTRNTHVKYESSISCHSTVIANVKYFYG